MAEIVPFENLASGTYRGNSNTPSIQSVKGIAIEPEKVVWTVKAVQNDPSKQSRSKDGDHMDESTKLLLERMDQDIRDHKQEIRDRDARLQNEMQERERRLQEDLRQREERMIAAMGDLKNEIVSIRDEMKSNTSHIQNLVRQNFWGNIATVLAILGICVTIGLTVWAAFQSK